MSACNLVVLTGLIFLTGVAALSAMAAAVIDRSGAGVDWVSRAWGRLMLRMAGVDLEVSGYENVDPGRSYIIISNHSSHFDVPTMFAALPDLQVRYLAKKELLKIPIFGHALIMAGHIMIDRSDREKAIESMRAARERILAGTSVSFFAEGTRSRDGRLGLFKKGGFMVALETGVPLLPLTIVGGWRVHHRDTWKITRGETIRVIVHPPVEPAGFSLETREALMETVRKAIAGGLEDGAPSQDRCATSN
ncbi:lysophospholipid acyltransferase family protein [Thermodesulfobacteriota bacterium]